MRKILQKRYSVVKLSLQKRHRHLQKAVVSALACGTAVILEFTLDELHTYLFLFEMNYKPVGKRGSLRCLKTAHNPQAKTRLAAMITTDHSFIYNNINIFICSIIYVVGETMCSPKMKDSYCIFPRNWWWGSIYNKQQEKNMNTILKRNTEKINQICSYSSKMWMLIWFLSAAEPVMQCSLVIISISRSLLNK